MLVNNFIMRAQRSCSGKKAQSQHFEYAVWRSRINISIEKINNSPAFVPEAIIYECMRDSM